MRAEKERARTHKHARAREREDERQGEGKGEEGGALQEGGDEEEEEEEEEKELGRGHTGARARGRAGKVGYRKGAGAWRGTLGAANTGARRPTGENAWTLTPCASALAVGYTGRYIASPRARAPGAPRAWPCECM